MEVRALKLFSDMALDLIFSGVLGWGLSLEFICLLRAANLGLSITVLFMSIFSVELIEIVNLSLGNTIASSSARRDFH